MPNHTGNLLAFLPLIQGEVEVDDGSELYFRQCNPQFVRGNQPSEQIFKPSSSDGEKLSGSRSTKTTAKETYEFRNTQKDGSTIGTWCITVAEAWDVGSRIIDDANSIDAPPFPIPPGHVYLDMRPFQSLNKVERRTLRSTLLIASLKRRRQYPT